MTELSPPITCSSLVAHELIDAVQGRTRGRIFPIYLPESTCAICPATTSPGHLSSERHHASLALPLPHFSPSRLSLAPSLASPFSVARLTVLLLCCIIHRADVPGQPQLFPALPSSSLPNPCIDPLQGFACVTADLLPPRMPDSFALHHSRAACWPDRYTR